MRLPELFCGFERLAGEPPVAYPVACLPQAWAAGSVFMMLQACLGLTVDAWNREVRVNDPRLPIGIDRLWIDSLRMGDDEDVARALAFIALTTGNLALVRVNGARGMTLPRLADAGHRAYWIVAAIACTTVALCITVPMLARAFDFAAPAPADAFVAALVGIAAALVFDLLKPLRRVRAALGRGARG